MREITVVLSNTEIEQLGLFDLVSHVRNAGIRDIQMLEDEGNTCLPQVEVDSRLDENLLNTLDCVDEWEHVAEKTNSHLYLIELTATELSEEIADDYDRGIGTCTPIISEQGVLLSYVGSQEAIRDILRYYEAAGISPTLHKLSKYQGDENTLDALTDRQLEVIRTAYDMGFYEIPREASTEDIAAELDLKPTTVLEHLQRTERNFLTKQLTE